MGDSTENDTLCERCSLLSFDDLAIGGREVVCEDGVARLYFPESQIDVRPRNWTPESYDMPSYQLIRLDWKFDDILPGMPRLAHSSQLGCAFCQALRRSLEEKFAKEARSDSMYNGPLNLVAYLSLADEGVEALLVEGTFNLDRLDEYDNVTFGATENRFWETEKLIQLLFPIEVASNCTKWLGAQPARNASYLDPIVIDKIRQSLDHCTSTCHPETPSSFMPTRLIDVGHDASSIPRLVLSSNIRKTEQTKYAALSYCWGNERDAESQFKTERASLESRCVGLPNEFMTPTTNDAIALARAIGLRYIWIDALCIVQDDKSDWSHECSQMDLVYRHAFVTFCSLNSDSCHESFLNRAPAVKIPFQSTIRKAIKGYYLIRLRPLTEFHQNRGKFAWDYFSSKWSKRCWTVQEDEMSTRLLLFGSLRMHFACARCRWSEGDEAPKDNRMRVLDQITGFKENRLSSTELYEYWNLLINNYGQRSVTFDKDRLPAIAGLARMVGEALQDQYVAGLWKGDLLCGLAWRSFSGKLSSGEKPLCGLEIHLQNIRQRNYVAPSWSWASCPAISSSSRLGNGIAEESIIVDIDVDTDSEDPFGQISGGFLRIRGRVAPMPTWLPAGQAYQGWSDSWYHRTGDIFDRLHIVTDWLHKDKEAGLELLVMMLLFRMEPPDETEAPQLRALLLHPADELNQYYRVGVIASTGNNAYKLMRTWFEGSREETICII